MGFSAIGIPGLIVILLIVLLIFGPKKLPEIGKATGQTLREFKNSSKDLSNDSSTSEAKTEEKDKAKR